MTDHEEWDAAAKNVTSLIEKGNPLIALKALLLLVRFGLKIRLSDYGAQRLIGLINYFLVKYLGG